MSTDSFRAVHAYYVSDDPKKHARTTAEILQRVERTERKCREAEKERLEMRDSVKMLLLEVKDLETRSIEGYALIERHASSGQAALLEARGETASELAQVRQSIAVMQARISWMIAIAGLLLPIGIALLQHLLK